MRRAPSLSQPQPATAARLAECPARIRPLPAASAAAPHLPAYRRPDANQRRWHPTEGAEQRGAHAQALAFLFHLVTTSHSNSIFKQPGERNSDSSIPLWARQRGWGFKTTFGIRNTGRPPGPLCFATHLPACPRQECAPWMAPTHQSGSWSALGQAVGLAAVSSWGTGAEQPLSPREGGFEQGRAQEHRTDPLGLEPPADGGLGFEPREPRGLPHQWEPLGAGQENGECPGAGESLGHGSAKAPVARGGFGCCCSVLTSTCNQPQRRSAGPGGSAQPFASALLQHQLSTLIFTLRQPKLERVYSQWFL